MRPSVATVIVCVLVPYLNRMHMCLGALVFAFCSCAHGSLSIPRYVTVASGRMAEPRAIRSSMACSSIRSRSCMESHNHQQSFSAYTQAQHSSRSKELPATSLSYIFQLSDMYHTTSACSKQLLVNGWAAHGLLTKALDLISILHWIDSHMHVIELAC